MTISTTLFETPGPHNTQRTVELALAAARELGIETIVIASTTGVVADCVLGQDLTGLHPVIVSHAYGFLEDGQNEMPQDKRRRYEQLGIPVCTAAHPLSGAERSLSNTFGGTYPVEIVAHTLRLFGQGTKVWRRGLGHRRRCGRHRAGVSDHRRRRHRKRRRYGAGAAPRPHQPPA